MTLVNGDEASTTSKKKVRGSTISPLETTTTPRKKIRGSTLSPPENTTKKVIKKVRNKVPLAEISTTPKRHRSKRPTRPQQARKQTVVPPVSCPDIFEQSVDASDGPLVRKTQHISDCKKYYECVIRNWLVRDCPDGTTFNGEDKNCDSEKSCKPSQVAYLYQEGVDSLKRYLGISVEGEEISEKEEILN